MSAEFDQYAADYKEIINRNLFTRLTGETFDYFVNLRLDTAFARIPEKVARWSRPRILDFGCGVGATEALLSQRFPDAEIFGIDPSPESIAAAEKQQLPNARFLVSDSITLPFETGFFDFIYSNGTFHHIEHKNHVPILRDLGRVVKPGGDVFVFENNPLNPATLLAMRTNPIDRDARVILPHLLKRRFLEAELQCRGLGFVVFFPQVLRALRPLERRMQGIPLGAQYYVWGSEG